MINRSLQLGQKLCDQDQKILSLFKNNPVKYIGHDSDFAQHLNTSDSASSVVLILNRAVWCSDIVKTCRSHLDSTVDKFYIGINRYYILGNDTTRQVCATGQPGQNIIEFLTSIVSELNFCVLESGSFDNDNGRYFNFIQPLTWIYGTKTTN